MIVFIFGSSTMTMIAKSNLRRRLFCGHKTREQNVAFYRRLDANIISLQCKVNRRRPSSKVPITYDDHHFHHGDVADNSINNNNGHRMARKNSRPPKASSACCCCVFRDLGAQISLCTLRHTKMAKIASSDVQVRPRFGPKRANEDADASFEFEFDMQAAIWRLGRRLPAHLANWHFWSSLVKIRFHFLLWQNLMSKL